MVQHLYGTFLTDESAYASAERHWSKLWTETSEVDRLRLGWTSPWFDPSQPPRDGNPIFSAVSETELKGIRVIQFQPTTSGVEFDYWLDYFGGEATDPVAIRELVISCALSREASDWALGLMRDWIVGDIRLDIGHSFDSGIQAS